MNLVIERLEVKCPYCDNVEVLESFDFEESIMIECEKCSKTYILHMDFRCDVDIISSEFFD